MKHHLSQKFGICSRLSYVEKNASSQLSRSLLSVAFLFITMAGTAQDACYLLGTDKIMEANHASATLEKQKDGVFSGEVTFDDAEFTVVTQLAQSADEWESIKRYRWSPDGEDIAVGQEKELFGKWKYEQNLRFNDRIDGRAYWVKVIFASSSLATICIYNDKNDDPDYVGGNDNVGGSDNDDNTEVPDIDLTSGAHFTINLTQAGSLKQRLTNAVMATDYDLVDFLTVRGKMNTADFIYLREQEGLVSQLQYLDLSDVEIEYDDQPYYSYSRGMIGSPTTVYAYYLSAENSIEYGGGGYNSMMTFYRYIHRNDLAHMFRGMSHLKQCKLPKTLKGVGEHIFDGTAIDKVTLPTAPEYLDNSAFTGTQLTVITLPESVDSLGAECFSGSPLAKIDISRVSRLGANCFNGTNLRTFELNEKVKTIPEGLFSNCQKLQTVTIPTSVQAIGVSAFQACGNLLTATLPASVTEIGDGAFNGCGNLTTVSMGDNVKRIGAGAFSYCQKLTDMNIPSRLEEVGKDAFAYDAGYYGSGSTTSIPCIERIAAENGVRYVGRVAYKWVDFSKSSLNIKEGTVSIADYFVGVRLGYGGDASRLTSITLPSTLRILGECCLVCTGISSITLPDALEKIGDRAFAGDASNGDYQSKLRRITIPKNVKYIGQEAFIETALVRVNYNAVEADTWKETTEDYSGNFYTAYSKYFPESVTRVIIGEGVKKIPDGLFRGCKNLVRVEMPSTVERIGIEAFYTEGDNLLHLDLPSSLQSIDMNALYSYPSFGTCNSFTAYMKEPIPLGQRPSDEEILNDPDVKNAIERGDRWQSSIERYTPFGTLYYRYMLDEQGHLTWEAPTVDSATDLSLQVPNGSLEAYRADPVWSALFKHITTFDGASDAETVEETTTVSVSQTVSDDTDLTGTLLGNVFVTLDTESGDGYSNTEGCLVINSTVSDEQLAAATADDADDLTVKNQFNGLIFEVPASKGRIVIDCQTLGQNVLYVKVGQGEPQKVESAGRSQATVPYNVSAPTHIYVYAAPKGTSASRQDTDQPLQARRRVAYANDDAVKVYGLSINVDDTSGIDTPRSATDSTAPWYTIDGRRVNGQPAQKGVYIHGSRKVVVK